MRRYGGFLSAPGVGRVVVASLVGRLPDAMIALALLLFLAPRSGFALAGAVTGAYSLAYAAASPARGRLVDRLGARPVLLVCGAVQPVVLLALAGAVSVHAENRMVVALSATAGLFTPPIAAVVRRIWMVTLPEERVRETALAFESVVAEAIFIAGTVLAGSLASLGMTSLLAAAACRFAGVLALAGLASTAALPRSRERLHWLGPLTSGPFRMLLVVIACNFAAFGALDVGIAAFARDAGAPSVTGMLLGLLGGGSILGGVVQGGRDWHAPLTRQQSGWLAAMTLGLAAVVLAPNLVLLGLLLAAAGLAVAPAATVQMSLGAAFAPLGATTEAFTWIASLSYVGFAAGNALAGRVVEDAGPRSALVAAAAFAGAATLLSLVGRHRLAQVLGRPTGASSRRPGTPRHLLGGRELVGVPAAD